MPDLVWGIVAGFAAGAAIGGYLGALWFGLWTVRAMHAGREAGTPESPAVRPRGATSRPGASVAPSTRPDASRGH